MSNKKVSILITDLDNTLYDWFEVWYQSFRAMLARLVKDTGLPEETLIKEIKEIHEQHGTSEYLMLVSEIPSLKRRHPNEDLTKLYSGAIKAYSERRKESLHLFPGVMETLEAIKAKGALIIGYTESQAFYSEFRVKYLGLDGIMDVLYSPKGHALPENAADQVHFFPLNREQLKFTKHHYTPEGEIKPNPDILLSIIRDIGASTEEAIYVGDSLTKDIVMAQAASVTDILATYGIAHTHKENEYELLRKVTHWTKEAVEKERAITKKEVIPTFILNNSFSELLNLFDFRPFASHLP